MQILRRLLSLFLIAFFMPILPLIAADGGWCSTVSRWCALLTCQVSDNPYEGATYEPPHLQREAQQALLQTDIADEDSDSIGSGTGSYVYTEEDWGHSFIESVGRAYGHLYADADVGLETPWESHVYLIGRHILLRSAKPTFMLFQSAELGKEPLYAAVRCSVRGLFLCEPAVFCEKVLTEIGRRSVADGHKLSALEAARTGHDLFSRGLGSARHKDYNMALLGNDFGTVRVSRDEDDFIGVLPEVGHYRHLFSTLSEADEAVEEE